MNTRSEADGTSGQNLRHLKHLLNLTYSAGSHAGKKGGSVTGGTLPAPKVNLLNLLDFLDPLSRPITASDEVYADGGGI
jgi:hypothetical protein